MVQKLVRRIAASIAFRVRRTRSRRYPAIVRRVMADHLTYLGVDGLNDLYQSVRALEKRAAPGLLIEAGCALGGSAIVLAHAKRIRRFLNVYDVFGMIPPPSDRDDADIHERYEEIKSGKAEGLEGDRYYGYEDDLLDKVTGNFAACGLPIKPNNVRLIQGLFQDTIHIDEPVALAHIDGDWYESVKTCLERIEPHLIPGGTLVIDDYEHWSGCRTAVDEYFADKRDRYEFVQKSRLHIIRSR